jgi:hypothetical protein
VHSAAPSKRVGPWSGGGQPHGCESGYSEHVELLPILDVALEDEQRRLERDQARGRRVEHGRNLLQVKRHLGLGHLLTEELLTERAQEARRRGHLVR